MSERPPLVGLAPPPLFADEVISVAAKDGVVMLTFAAPSLPETASSDDVANRAPVSRSIVTRVALPNSAAWLLLSRLGSIVDAIEKDRE